MADDSEDGPPVALSFAAGKELTIELSQKQSKEIQRYCFVYFIQWINWVKLYVVLAV